MQPLHAALYLLPLTARMFLTTAPIGADELKPFLEGWLRLTLLILVWLLAQALVAHYRSLRLVQAQDPHTKSRAHRAKSKEPGAKSRAHRVMRKERRAVSKERRVTCGEALWLLGLIGIASLLMVTLQSIKLNFSDTFFALALFALGNDALAQALRYRERPNPALVLRLIVFATVGYLTFQIPVPRWHWQPWLFSLGIAAAATAVEAASVLNEQLKRSDTSRCVSKLYQILLLLAPTSIAMLVFAGQLPQVYFMPYVTLLLVVPLAQAAQRAQVVTDLPSQFRGRTAANALLFVVILALTGIW